MYMLEANLLQGKKLLLIDKDTKQTNDRTWCFWQKEPNMFESIVYKKWENLQVYAPNVNKLENIHPYVYKMIRGIDFYNYCLQTIQQHPNIEIITGTIQSITSNSNGATVVVNQREYTATYCFSSILLQEPLLGKNQHYLLQHFKGQIIETDTPVFDSNTATYMDFTVPQTHGTTFGYVLPFTATKALVEYTLFTKNVLTTEQYDEGLKSYITNNLKINTYKVVETEQGIIPMTDYNFKKSDDNIVYIGTAGGNTRGSTGYTFNYIQKNSKAIVDALIHNIHPAKAKTVMSATAKYYDSILLTVLANNYVAGQNVFANIFKKVRLKKVLSFLDDDNNFANDIQIIWSQPKWPFMKAALKKILN